jgi:hypothetical protein
MSKYWKNQRTHLFLRKYLLLILFFASIITYPLSFLFAKGRVSFLNPSFAYFRWDSKMSFSARVKSLRQSFALLSGTFLLARIEKDDVFSIL